MGGYDNNDDDDDDHPEKGGGDGMCGLKTMPPDDGCDAHLVRNRHAWCIMMVMVVMMIII